MPIAFQTIESPCEKICVMDPEINICVGCNRTLDEIANWASYTHAERRAIMVALPARVGGDDEAKKSA
jgi:uncharacterized protein